MINRIRITLQFLAGLALLMTLTNAPAQTTSTYAVLSTNFRLTAKVQTATGKVSTVAVSNKDLLRAIGAATTNAFSPKARLFFLFRAAGGVPFFVIRDGAREANIRGFLIATQVGTPLGAFRTNSAGLVTGNEYVIEQFKLVNLLGNDFDIRGFNINGRNNRGLGRSLLPDTAATSLAVSVSGQGHLGGNLAILQGTVNAFARKLEQHAD